MRIWLPVILFFSYIFNDNLKSRPVLLFGVKDKITTPPKRPFTTTLIGYVKNNSGHFNASDGCGQTNLVTAVYSNTRLAGQVGVGDILYQSNGTTPFDGHGGEAWGFTPVSGHDASRGLKIGGGGSGMVDDISTCSLVARWYHNASGAANCAGSGFANAIYDDATSENPGLYNGKIIYNSIGGQKLLTGTYTVSNKSGGSSVYTFSIASNNGIVASLAYCLTNPVADAGTDQVVSLPSPSITLDGSNSFDPDGFISGYSWSQTSGPNTSTITTPSAVSTTITGVIAGTYTYHLVCTDNGSNTESDDVQVTVVAAPICATPTKFPIKPYMIWGPNGEYGQGSQMFNDTFSHKYGNILGRAFVNFDMDYDPLNGKFDADSTRAGFQNDSTIPTIERVIHAYYDLGNGSERVVVADWGKRMYWDQLWWYDSTNASISNCAEIFIGSLEKIRAAVYEWKIGIAQTPDYLVSTQTARGWYKIINMRDTGQFMCIRYKNVNSGKGPNITSWVPYGCAAPGGEMDTRITPDWNMILNRDTTYTSGMLSGLVVATPLPGPATFWNDTLFYSNGKGGYIGYVAGIGIVDTAKISWKGVSLSTNNISFSPYDHDPHSLYFDSSFYVNAYRREYEVDKSANGYLLNQTSYSTPEYIPIDSSTADRRLQSSYGRYAFQFLLKFFKLCNYAPNLSSGYAQYFTHARIIDDPFVDRWNWGRIKYLIPYNENWAGFRDGGISGANYQSPIAEYAMHDTIRQEMLKINPNAKLTGQGFAAWGIEGIIEAEFLGRLWYMDKAHPMCDILNLHTINNKILYYDIDKGCAGQDQVQGLLAERSETSKLQAWLDTMAMVSGVYRNAIITESSTGATINPDYAMPNASCNGITVIGAKQIKSYKSHESQGYIKGQYHAEVEAVRGIEGHYDYEMGDAADTSSVFRNNNDNNNGRRNGLVASPWYKATHFILEQHHKWVKDYRVWSIVSDSVSGQFTTLYRNINPAKKDSFCLYTHWRGYANAGSARTYTLAADVTSVTRLEYLLGDWTMSGTSVATTVTAGTVSFATRPEADHIFFKSPVLSSLLDRTATTGYPVNPKIKGSP